MTTARRGNLPQAGGATFITDGGMETTLIFQKGLDLPEFAAFVLAERVRGLRANASTKSHAELDESDELDSGDPVDLAGRYAALRERLPRLNVVGGCCGTDERHVAEICRAFAG